MALVAQSVTVGTAPTLLNGYPDTDGVFGNDVAVYNPSASVVVYIGPAGVTTTTGFPLQPLATLALEVKPADKVYGVVASGTQPVNVLGSGD